MTDSVYQGDSVELNFAIDNRQLNEDWLCRIQVKTSPTATVVLAQTLPLNALGTKFTGTLSTSLLTPGSYFIYAQIDNATTNESVEIHSRIVVRQQGFTE